MYDVSGGHVTHWLLCQHIPTLTEKSLATLDGEIVDPEITIKIKMRDVLKVYDVQT